MISAILLCGTLAVLVTALIKDISDTYRGMICWTFSALASLSAVIVYFACFGDYRPDFSIVISGLAGAGLIAVIVLIIELLAPTKRFRMMQHTDYDRSSAENALNIVMIIAAGVSSAAVCCCEWLSAVEFSIFGLIPAAAVSVRQLSLYLHRTKMDTLTADEVTTKKKKLVKQLETGKKSL